MKELIDHIESEDWTVHHTIEKRGVATENVYIHPSSYFAIHISPTQFNFKASWKLFKFETGWINYHSIKHFNIFSLQAAEIDGVLSRYTNIRKK